MKVIYSLLILAGVLFLFFSSGCDDTLNNQDLDNLEIPDENVSFSEHLFPVFQLKCASSGCHDSESRAAGLSMIEHTSITQPGIVNPGSPETSRLIWSIFWEQYGFEPMPPLTSNLPLNENQRDGVWTWILEGAKNN
jgi:hypothetical protein